MERCCLTGVEFSLDNGFVLNRRAVRRMLNELNLRSERLQKLLLQYGPLDVVPITFRARAKPKQHQATNESKQAVAPATRTTQKKHRLLCEAAAKVLNMSEPDLDLFITWPRYVKESAQLRKPGARHGTN